jgi:hypothetical protein
MTVKFTNNASTTVGTGINASATSLTVASASSFPSLSGADDYCYLTLQGATNTTREVVKATALSSNTFTIVRAQDNTSAASWVAGDIVELRMTAALLTDVIDAATVEGVKTNYQYTPTAGQTVFSGADNASATMIINQAALVSVYMNGVRLVQGTDYSVSSANNTVTLGIGATTADIIDIEVYGNFVGQSGAAVGITGGSITGTAITATSLGATGTATLNTLVSNNATISGGSLDGVTIGGTTRGAISGNAISGTSFASTGNMTFGDNNKAIFGAGSDLQIGHDGSVSFITDSGTGDLYIQGSSAIRLTNPAGNETFAVFNDNGAASLYYDNGVSLSTTASGISVTGTVTASTSFATGVGIIKDIDSNSVMIGSGAVNLRMIDVTGDIRPVTADGLGVDATIDLGDSAARFKDLYLSGTVTAGAATFSGDVNIDKASPLLIFKESAAAKLFIGESSVVGGGGAGFYDFYAVTGLGQRFFTNSVQRMTISSAGNVGIGTPTITSGFKLEVTGDARFGDAVGDDAVELGWSSGGSQGFIQAYDRGASAFRPLIINNSLTVNASGNVGISESNPVAKIHIQGSGTSGQVTSSLILENSSSGTAGLQITGAAGSSHLDFMYGGGPSTGTNTLTTGMSMTLEGSGAGNVGIGTDSAVSFGANTAGLTINGSSGSHVTWQNNGTNVAFAYNVGNNFSIGSEQAGSTLSFLSSGSNRMTIDAGGSVLIGKTTPADLHASWNHIIIGEKGAIISTKGGVGLDGITLADNAYVDSDTGNYAYQTTGAASQITQTGGAITFSNAASGSAGAALTPVQTMAINADRKVDVGGVANQTAAVLNARFNGAAIEFGHGNNGAGYYGTAGSYGNNGQPYIGFSCDGEESVNTFTTRGAKGNIITGDLSGNLTFAQVTTASATGQTPVNRMMLDASGNLLVGTTSRGYGLFSSSRVTLGDGDTGDGFCVGGLNQDLSAYTVQADNNAGTRYFAYIANGSSTPVGTISFTSTATAYNTSSDQRLKENIADADDAGSKIDAIQVRKFDWKADGSHQDYGMVAQELLEVAPEAVSAPEDPEEMMGVDYSKLVPMMLKEIQSLRARIAALES